jgi:alpha-glucosidase
MFPYLSGSGFLLQNSAGETAVNDIWYGRVGWLDFTRQAAADWYRSTLRSFLAWGIDAVWNDLNEPAQNWMSDAIYDFNGERRTDAEARNLYALREAAVSYDAQRELRPNVRPWGIS